MKIKYNIYNINNKFLLLLLLYFNINNNNIYCQNNRSKSQKKEIKSKLPLNKDVNNGKLSEKDTDDSDNEGNNTEVSQGDNLSEMKMDVSDDDSNSTTVSEGDNLSGMKMDVSDDDSNSTTISDNESNSTTVSEGDNLSGMEMDVSDDEGKDNQLKDLDQDNEDNKNFDNTVDNNLTKEKKQLVEKKAPSKPMTMLQNGLIGGFFIGIFGFIVYVYIKGKRNKEGTTGTQGRGLENKRSRFAQKSRDRITSEDVFGRKLYEEDSEEGSEEELEGELKEDLEEELEENEGGKSNKKLLFIEKRSPVEGKLYEEDLEEELEEDLEGESEERSEEELEGELEEDEGGLENKRSPVEGKLYEEDLEEELEEDLEGESEERSEEELEGESEKDENKFKNFNDIIIILEQEKTSYKKTSKNKIFELQKNLIPIQSLNDKLKTIPTKILESMVKDEICTKKEFNVITIEEGFKIPETRDTTKINVIKFNSDISINDEAQQTQQLEQDREKIEAQIQQYNNNIIKDIIIKDILLLQQKQDTKLPQKEQDKIIDEFITQEFNGKYYNELDVQLLGYLMDQAKAKVADEKRIPLIKFCEDKYINIDINIDKDFFYYNIIENYTCIFEDENAIQTFKTIAETQLSKTDKLDEMIEELKKENNIPIIKKAVTDPASDLRKYTDKYNELYNALNTKSNGKELYKHMLDDTQLTQGTYYSIPINNTTTIQVYIENIEENSEYFKKITFSFYEQLSNGLIIKKMFNINVFYFFYIDIDQEGKWNHVEVDNSKYDFCQLASNNQNFIYKKYFNDENLQISFLSYDIDKLNKIYRISKDNIVLNIAENFITNKKTIGIHGLKYDRLIFLLKTKIKKLYDEFEKFIQNCINAYTNINEKNIKIENINNVINKKIQQLNGAIDQNTKNLIHIKEQELITKKKQCENLNCNIIKQQIKLIEIENQLNSNNISELQTIETNLESFIQEIKIVLDNSLTIMCETNQIYKILEDTMKKNNIVIDQPLKQKIKYKTKNSRR